MTAVEDEIKGGVGDGSGCSDGLVMGEDDDLGGDGGVGAGSDGGRGRHTLGFAGSS